MRKIAVKWLKSPRTKYGIPRAPGSASLVEVEIVKKILKDDPNFLVPLEPLDKEKPPEVKDTQFKKPKTRPVTRAKDS